MDNLTIITNEYETLKGQHVISNDTVYRLIGIADDTEDWYYCLYDGRKLYLHSCVGSVIPLKGFIEDKHYNEFVRLSKINDFDQTHLWGNKNPDEMLEFNESHKKELLSNWDSKTHLILGPYWELN